MIVAATIMLVHVVLLAILFVGWRMALSRGIAQSHTHFLTVIVPVRNEEKNIASLVENLSNQSYSPFEVIFVDDHSSDNSRAILLKSQTSSMRVVVNEGEGKKMAIETGVRSAAGEIIVTTDADCVHPANWLRAINRALTPDIQLVAGPVRIGEAPGLWSRLQQLEFASLIGSTAATIAVGIPLMCNGANLAYRKRAFQAVDGFKGNESIPSGDDEFLMRKIDKTFPKAIAFLCDASAIVSTGHQPTLRGFFHQRLRWASKWKHNASFASRAIAVEVWLTQVATIALIAVSVITADPRWLMPVGVKAVLEMFLLIGFCSFLRVRFDVIAFILLLLIYPFYITGTGVLSMVRTYRWKDRKFAP